MRGGRGAFVRDVMPQVFKSRPPSGRSRKRKLLEGEPDAEPGFNAVQQQSELWLDKYAPKTVSDLAVHNKKITDVSSWLTSRLHDPGWRQDDVFCKSKWRP